MALMHCPEHGWRGCAAVCSHVAALVYAGTPIPQRLFPMSVSYAGELLGPTLLCQDCASQFDVPADGVTLPGEDGFERFWSDVDWKPVCVGCFDPAVRVGSHLFPPGGERGYLTYRWLPSSSRDPGWRTFARGSIRLAMPCAFWRTSRSSDSPRTSKVT